MRKNVLILLSVLSLAVFSVNCGDVLTGGILDESPNSAAAVTTAHLFVGTQTVTYGFVLGDLGTYTSVWMQQMAGVDQQWSQYEDYGVTNTLFPGWQQMYAEGGLIDIRDLKARALAEGKTTILGLTKLYEAMIFSSGADVWGDIPYTEAALEAYPNPHYDTQLSVHTACLALLDEAIAHLNVADPDEELFEDKWDMSFDGDLDKAIAAAHTLKARILLNWGKVTPANYALALAEAEQGISSTSGNWMSPHADISDQQNIWYQFYTLRGKYVRAGALLVDMLDNDADPRLEFYYGEDDDGGYSGSAHTDDDDDASWLNDDTWGEPAWDYDILSYEENQMIIAECQARAGLEAEAVATLNAALTAMEVRWNGFKTSPEQTYGIIPKYDAALSGEALIEAIVTEKYKANFLNPQIWNDWKRTGYPNVISLNGKPVPRRFMYTDDEQNSNTNFPGTIGIDGRNANDPASQ